MPGHYRSPRLPTLRALKHMQLAEAMKRLETVVATTGSPDADTTAIGRALSASSQLKSFLAAQDAELAKMLHAVPGSFPEATLADATRCSLNDAVRDTDRAATLGHADAMADALANNDVLVHDEIGTNQCFDCATLSSP